MKSIKLLIKENGFELLKILMEEWYLTESIVNNSSEVDDINVIKHPDFQKRIHTFVYLFRSNLKDYDIRFLEMSLNELQNKDIPYSYILEENNQISSIVEHKVSVQEIDEIQKNEDSLEMEF